MHIYATNMQKHVIIIRLYLGFVKLFPVIYVKICKLYTKANKADIVFVADYLFALFL